MNVQQLQQLQVHIVLMLLLKVHPITFYLDLIRTVMSQGNDPSISAKVGDTFTFNVNSPGHPFYLIIVSNGGIDSNNLINGVTKYYICEISSPKIQSIRT